MRRPIIAGNWKMNKNLQEGMALVEELVGPLEAIQGVEKVLCPPFILLPLVAERLKGTSIGLGAQNMHWEEKGAYTGEISPHMLQGLCQYVILGHSERRAANDESATTVNRKVHAALAHVSLRIAS